MTQTSCMISIQQRAQAISFHELAIISNIGFEATHFRRVKTLFLADYSGVSIMLHL